MGKDDFFLASRVYRRRWDDFSMFHWNKDNKIYILVRNNAICIRETSKKEVEMPFDFIKKNIQISSFYDFAWCSACHYSQLICSEERYQCDFIIKALNDETICILTSNKDRSVVPMINFHWVRSLDASIVLVSWKWWWICNMR
jgi:hypothetical protein